LKISGEIEPLRWFIDKLRANIFFNFPMLAGIGPSRLLLCDSRIINFERFPIDEGIWPDRLVLYKKSSVKFPSSPMLSGITPDMNVVSTSRASRPIKLPMAEGMLPRMPVPPKLRSCRVVERFTIELGRCPVIAVLPLISNTWIWLQLDNEVIKSHPSDSLACSMFPYKFRCCSARSLPIVRGTNPMRLFSARWSSWSDARFVSEAGINPVNWFV
jgi:hypothetical protein